ncbi:MAG TPA: methyltransferase [Acidimicrobiia bacterium]
MTSPRLVRELLGVPFVPPAWVSRAVVAMRRRLAALHRGTAPASIRVLEGLFGLVDNRVLGLLVELDVPERLDRPRTSAELAVAVDADEANLERLLRYAAGRGFVRRDRRGRYRANDVTTILRRDHTNSWRGWVEFAGSDWFWDAFRHLDAPVRGQGSGVEAATGRTFFDFVTDTRPDAGDAFNRAMAAGAAVQALALERAFDWSTVQTVCDVGGGTGATLEHLLGARPHLEGVLLDLPEVVAAARPALTAGELRGRCRIEGGSFFEPIPAGADRYLLLAIVHDWHDADAVRILCRVREAMGASARAVVVEGLVPERPRDEFVQASDLLMCALATGRERTEAEFDALFAESGLGVVQRVRLATGFVAFELEARP